MPDVWDSEGENTQEVTVIVNGETVYDGEEPIDAAKLKEIVQEEGVKKFTVTKDGQVVNPSAFPLAGKIVVEEYNEAK